MSSTLSARGITPLRVIIGLAILAALILGSVWAGGGFDSSAPHQVTVRVGGGLGTIYRIQGAPDGDTGPMTFSGDSKYVEFATDKDVENLGLTVTVTPSGGGTAGCSISYDGHAVALSHPTGSGDGSEVCRVGG